MCCNLRRNHCSCWRLRHGVNLTYDSCVYAKVDALLAEGSGESEYAEKSVKLEPMNGRQRWLIHEFVGSSTSAIKLINLNGPHFARGMEVRSPWLARAANALWLGI